MTNINLLNEHDEAEAHELYCVSSGSPWCIPSDGKMTVKEILREHGGVVLYHGARAMEHNLRPESAFGRLYDAHNELTKQYFTNEVSSAEEYLLARRESVVINGDSLVQNLWQLFFFEVTRLKICLRKLYAGEIDWIIVTFSGVQSLNVMRYVLEKPDTSLALANTCWEAAYVY